MQFVLKSLFALILTVMIAPAVQAQNACSKTHFTTGIQADGIHADQSLSRQVLRFMDLLGSGSTTSLRKEDKYVVVEKAIDQKLSELQTRYPESFQLRDKKRAGMKNITVTDYALPMKILAPNGKPLSAKARFRVYYEADASKPLSLETMTRAEFVKDRQFVEFKIDHPEFDQVVIKPRMLILDSDAAMIKNRSQFLANKEAILERALAMNPKTDPAVIRQFFQIFSEFYTAARVNLPEFARTTYVRDSYSLMLKDVNGKDVEIQITVDREVEVLNSTNGQIVRAYEASDAVVEIKVPVAYAQLTARDLAQVPGLAEVLNLKKELEKDHLDQFAPGAGKLSTFRRTQEAATELIGD